MNVELPAPPAGYKWRITQEYDFMNRLDVRISLGQWKSYSRKVGFFRREEKFSVWEDYVSPTYERLNDREDTRSIEIRIVDAADRLLKRTESKRKEEIQKSIANQLVGEYE